MERCAADQGGVPINLWPNAAQAYHHWVRASLAENKPYDRFVRELLTSSGSNFRVGPVNFYRAIQNRTPEGITGAVALTFMGSRVDSWPHDRLRVRRSSSRRSVTSRLASGRRSASSGIRSIPANRLPTSPEKPANGASPNLPG